MKTGTEFDTKAQMAILLLGENGTGKSALAMRWPDPWFCLGDKNIKFAAEWAAANNKKWFYDDPERDDKGVTLPWERRWARAEELLAQAGANPECKTIVDDGLTHLASYLQAFIIKEGSKAESALVIGGESVMTRSMWGPFANKLKRRIIAARSYNKPYIMIGHTQVDENELSGVKEQKVNLQGALKNELGSWFSDVWALEAVPSTDPKYKAARGVRYFVRTAPTHRMRLKCSCGLPAEIDVDELVKLLPGIQG